MVKMSDMSSSQARAEVWARLSQSWDLIVVGGGITGAGILREATRAGLKALLIEQKDIAWGTSSRSSKLVHGGLRYLAQGHVLLTYHAVRERERLIREGPGLVDRLDFMLASYTGDRPSIWIFGVGLLAYDLLAGCWDHEYHGAKAFGEQVPQLDRHGLAGGFRYHDAQTDDSRLVLRVMREAVDAGGTVLTYAPATELILEGGQAVGVRVKDMAGSGQVAECRARAVINATGVWADRLRQQVKAPPRMRPLRGSHLIFSAERLPVKEAFTLQHPIDHRVMFVFPWEEMTVVGTTDLDHDLPLDEEPSISAQEVAYLMAAVEARFPTMRITLEDIISSYSGVRPVVNSGKADPSKETRDHVVWSEDGLITVTGGKLTTFRLIARDALKVAGQRLPGFKMPKQNLPLLNRMETTGDGWGSLPEGERRRLAGKYGADALKLIQAAQPGELERIPGCNVLWAELRWAARSEWVVHLDDLLLRRVRLGLLVPAGAQAFLPRIRAICQAELGWDDARWQREEGEYLERWRKHYSVPEASLIPDWRVMLAQSQAIWRPRAPELAAGAVSTASSAPAPAHARD